MKDFDPFEIASRKYEQLIRVWEPFIQAVQRNPTFRNLTLEDWKRCRDIGIDPDHIVFRFLPEEELRRKQSEHRPLIEAAQPFLEQLSLSLTGKSHVVALSDAEGCILAILGTAGQFGGRKVGFAPGASWAEKDIGNNGIGTALSRGRPVFVYGIEHYGRIYGSWACIGIPIRGRKDEVVGALDISVLTQDAHPARLTLALASARSIEKALAAYAPDAPPVPHPGTRLEAMEGLLATTMHDLRNPLAIIQALSDLGGMTAASEKEKDFFFRIGQQANVLGEMIRSLLVLHAPEEFVPVSVRETVQKAVDEIRPVCEVSRIDIEVFDRGDFQAPLKVSLFARAIHNLLRNAIQAMPGGGRLRVEVDCREEEQVAVVIGDTGGGIPDELQPVLFTPFAHGPRSGVGLGLYMVYQTITKVHQGTIRYRTETGQGTTFTIRVPKRRREREG